MKSLLILRHAEATPVIPELSDVHRPLAECGRTQARDLGMWLRDRAIAPDRILCSAAVRARETGYRHCHRKVDGTGDRERRVIQRFR